MNISVYSFVYRCYLYFIYYLHLSFYLNFSLASIIFRTVLFSCYRLIFCFFKSLFSSDYVYSSVPLLGGTFVDVKVAPRSTALLPPPIFFLTWWLLYQQAGLICYSLFDSRREESEIRFRPAFKILFGHYLFVGGGGQPGSCSGLKKYSSFVLAYYISFLSNTLCGVLYWSDSKELPYRRVRQISYEMICIWFRINKTLIVIILPTNSQLFFIIYIYIYTLPTCFDLIRSSSGR
jgi:hypothetical protein